MILTQVSLSFPKYNLIMTLIKITNDKESRKQTLPNTTSDSDEENINVQKRKKPVGKRNKNQLNEEKLKKRDQLTRDRALKTIAAKRLKNLRPGECMKFVEVVLDEGIENSAAFAVIINTLMEANVQYSINTELISNSITWKRNVEHSYVNEDNQICTVSDIERVNQILLIWNWDKAVTEVEAGSFSASISSIKSLLPNSNIILVIFEIEDYFAYHKKGAGKGKAKTQAGKTGDQDFKNFPEISRRRLESCLNEVQIIAGCSSRLINSRHDLALMVYQCTKAIAETPYKLEKNKGLSNKFDWYVMGDNKNTVKVDKDGNGLKRLWQQQLRQFNLSSLEIAEAICSVYPSPANLVEAYMNCTDDEGINLLKDIPIRRAAGPLTTARRVGPELSKKIYLMFTSRDGESVLN
ncbi:crossover junction endonuclease EME1 isoform X2 [Ceratina calcarata]|uniref:Crossover junction endonuclease EME1 isoform X2 n=1 Tax=Ceratina calcarata TaxID=156304 RepID=A0AAJ7JCC0_9HYME|nr:crossover junction endonuclease EME1 isoform X2 [Ceratina calcarata]